MYSKKLLFFFLGFLLIKTCVAKDVSGKEKKVNLAEKNRLSLFEGNYPYSTTFTFGTRGSVIRGLFTKTSERSNNVNDIDYNFEFYFFNPTIGYNWAFTNDFFADRLGVFPRLGFDIQILSFNYFWRFFAHLIWPNIIIAIRNGSYHFVNFFVANCQCTTKNKMQLVDWRGKFKTDFLKKPHGIINIPITFEPEIGFLEKFKCIPQVGVGLSIIFLSRNCFISENFVYNMWPDNNADFDNDKGFYKGIVDLFFSFKMIFKTITTNNFLNAFHFELGYNYNPLILSYIFDWQNAQIEGGLVNVFFNLVYARHKNIGLETVEFYNTPIETSLDNSLVYREQYDKGRKDKYTIFLDGGIGLGKWLKINDTVGLKLDMSFSPNLHFSFSMPYYGFQLSKYHYLSFVGVDVGLDLYRFVENTHNIIWNFVDYLNVVYNFINFTNDYGGIKFMHKIGMYAPLFTNMLSSIDYGMYDGLRDGYLWQREMIAVINKKAKYSAINKNTWWAPFSGRFVYRFKVYLDIFRLVGKKFKYDTFFYAGFNSVLINRRNDYKTTAGEFGMEVIKLESINFGISFKFY